MVHHHIQVPEEVKTPDELYNFFYGEYSKSPKEELLELMRESVTEEQLEQLGKREHDELAKVYSHGMVAGFFVCSICHAEEGGDTAAE